MMGFVFGSGPSGMALPAAASLRAGRLDLISLLCQSVVHSPHARPRGTAKRLVQSLSHKFTFTLTRHVNILLAPSPSPHFLNLHHDVTEDTENETMTTFLPHRSLFRRFLRCATAMTPLLSRRHILVWP
ncbi:hypothetical protein H0G86_004619 [Trichoderma simmonsii]|uniref:Uncharacterized protein n=1 Tax=Trichoderma simmonsii TaxID=1491479 RepID=A0A8G0L7X1_9HYPO|nr:hypothetical protein H0G86_004619 [Trichoderma simmonsii]